MKRIHNIAFCVIASIAATCCTACGDESPKTEKQASFYHLEQAYSRDLLTQDDLRNIAYYYGLTTYGYQPEEGFTPSPKTPETLDEATQKEICNDYYRLSSDKEVPLDQYFIAHYYGTYHGHVAISISDTYHVCHDPVYVEGYSVGGVFIGDYASGILVWVTE